MLDRIRESVVKRLSTAPVTITAAAIYGSWARETPKGDSDIDILLIADGLNPKRHRRGKEIAAIKEWLSLDLPADLLLLTPTECLSNFRNHNPLFLDIACEGVVLLDKDNLLQSLIDETRGYISDRRLKKLRDGWAFPLSYRQPSLLSQVSNRDFAIAMLTDGERDFEIGVTILEKDYFDKAVYHFQQAAEKAVKSILICFGIFKKTHFVGEILIKVVTGKDACPTGIELDPGWKEKLIQIGRVSLELEPEVTWSRYPGIDDDTLWIPCEEYTREDALEIKERCEKVATIAKGFLDWWFGL